MSKPQRSSATANLLRPACAIQRRLRIGLFGEFSAGKSTLLNSLVEQPLQDVSVAPTTKVITIIHPPGGFSDDAPPQGAVTKECDARLLLAGSEFWDTPGPNSLDKQHLGRAREAMEEVDLAIYLVDATRGCARSDIEIFKELKAAQARELNPDPLIVLTHFDRVCFDDPEEADELLDDFRQKFGLKRQPQTIDARDLGRFDGRALRNHLKESIRLHATSCIVREFVENRDHYLRGAVSAGAYWRDYVPTALRTDELRSKVVAWIDWVESRRLLRDAECALVARSYYRSARQESLAHYQSVMALIEEGGIIWWVKLPLTLWLVLDWWLLCHLRLDRRRAMIAGVEENLREEFCLSPGVSSGGPVDLGSRSRAPFRTTGEQFAKTDELRRHQRSAREDLRAVTSECLSLAAVTAVILFAPFFVSLTLGVASALVILGAASTALVWKALGGAAPLEPAGASRRASDSMARPARSSYRKPTARSSSRRLGWTSLVGLAAALVLAMWLGWAAPAIRNSRALRHTESVAERELSAGDFASAIAAWRRLLDENDDPDLDQHSEEAIARIEETWSLALLKEVQIATERMLARQDFHGALQAWGEYSRNPLRVPDAKELVASARDRIAVALDEHRFAKAESEVARALKDRRPAQARRALGRYTSGPGPLGFEAEISQIESGIRELELDIEFKELRATTTAYADSDRFKEAVKSWDDYLRRGDIGRWRTEAKTLRDELAHRWDVRDYEEASRLSEMKRASGDLEGMRTSWLAYLARPGGAAREVDAREALESIESTIENRAFEKASQEAKSASSTGRLLKALSVWDAFIGPDTPRRHLDASRSAQERLLVRWAQSTFETAEHEADEASSRGDHERAFGAWQACIRTLLSRPEAGSVEAHLRRAKERKNDVLARWEDEVFREAQAKVDDARRRGDLAVAAEVWRSYLRDQVDRGDAAARTGNYERASGALARLNEEREEREFRDAERAERESSLGAAIAQWTEYLSRWPGSKRRQQVVMRRAALVDRAESRLFEKVIRECEVDRRLRRTTAVIERLDAFILRTESETLKSRARRERDAIHRAGGGESRDWIKVEAVAPDPRVISDTGWRRRIAATGLPWRIRDSRSGIVFLLVPPGEYMRGTRPEDLPTENQYGRSNLNRFIGESPRHRVRISRPFYLARCELTLEEAAKLGFRLSRSSRLAKGRPASVTWSWVTRILKKSSFELPTEAQWEYACRAGDDLVKYGRIDAIAWHRGNVRGAAMIASASDSTMIPYQVVGEKQPNALGFHDMIGNISEWCADRYTSYSQELGLSRDKVLVDPRGVVSSDSRRFTRFRVTRGGDVLTSGDDYCRPAARAPVFLDQIESGMRVALSVSD